MVKPSGTTIRISEAPRRETAHTSSRKMFVDIDFSKYPGRYVAIVNNHVVSSGQDAKTVWAGARKKNPAAVPTLLKVPKGETLVLL